MIGQGFFLYYQNNYKYFSPGYLLAILGYGLVKLYVRMMDTYNRLLRADVKARPDI